MENILEKIEEDVKQKYYQQNFANNGQRFVAWYMRNIHCIDEKQTRDSVTDGANDKQIDAVYIDEDEQKIFIVQGKYYLGDDNIGAEPVQEVIASWVQIKDLARLQENANEKLKIKVSEIANALAEDSYCICFELVTTSIFSEAAQKDIEAFQRVLSDNDDSDLNCQLSVIDRQGLADAYNRTLEQTSPVLNHTMSFETGKYLVTEISATRVLIAAVPLKDCIEIPGIKDGTLFQKNVRQSLGISNSVNKKIKNTINNPDKCSDFFFFHNGVTAICNKMEDLSNGTFRFHALNVVNGCQSLTTILSCSENAKKRADAYILFRFYEIMQRDRADSISTNTNTQSTVKARDLRSNSKQVLKLKKSYENYYSDGFFATKRGEIPPFDKKDNVVDLSKLGKQLTAWYMQRPNLSYGETKIFDKYFSTLFKNEYSPKDIYALNFWMKKIMDAWEDENNPLGLNDIILTMRAYAPYHLLYAISVICGRCNNNQTNVPSPAECLRLAQKEDIVDVVVQLAAECLNNAEEIEQTKYASDGKTFVPQNWVKSKASINAIIAAVINCFSFAPQAKKLKESLKMDASFFSYRVQADD